MLAPAYFSRNYKYFDQLLQTVKNKSTVLILVFKELLQTSIPPLTSVLYAKGYHEFSVEKFSSHSAKKFRRRTRLCFRKFRVSKNFMPKRRISRYSMENLLSHSTEKFRWGTLRCFRKFRASQNFVHNKGISLNSVEKSLSHSADKIRRRTLLCLERILVSKSFKQKRGEASWFCRNFFISQDRKNFARELFVFQKNSGREKYFMDKTGGGGGVSRFSVQVFVTLYRKTFVRVFYCF